MTQSIMADSALIAELNDLLQLDHDALAAYSLAIAELDSQDYKTTVTEFRRDHERHVEELTALIKQRGGIPVQISHQPTGIFKLAMQGLGAVGGDREVLIAWRTNERQARDKYARAAAKPGLPQDVHAAFARGAADEARHYEWADRTLRALGVTEDSRMGRALGAVETMHARTADAIEAVEKKGMAGVEAARRGISKGARSARNRPLVAAVAAVGVGLLVTTLLRRSGSRSSGGYLRKPSRGSMKYGV
jgi:rubrerythrin